MQVMAKIHPALHAGIISGVGMSVVSSAQYERSTLSRRMQRRKQSFWKVFNLSFHSPSDVRW